MSDSARTAAQMRALHKIAALQEARALADLARLNGQLAVLRADHRAVGDERDAARQGAANLSDLRAAEKLGRWAAQRQAALNMSIARLAAQREALAQAAQRSVGRADALRDLIARQIEAARRRTG